MDVLSDLFQAGLRLGRATGASSAASPQALPFNSRQFYITIEGVHRTPSIAMDLTGVEPVSEIISTVLLQA